MPRNFCKSVVTNRFEKWNKVCAKPQKFNILVWDLPATPISSILANTELHRSIIILKYITVTILWKFLGFVI